jgi:hypothetical protein
MRGITFLHCVEIKIMEQQLINSLMKLLAKAGGGSLVKDLVQQVDQSGNPKVWTPSEVAAAVSFVNEQIENFGTADARAIVDSLQKKYHLSLSDRSTPGREDLPEVPGVHGLR